jgi:aspartate 1-decarboxylase
VQRIMLKSKIHRATVTDADLHYEGSISIDANLLEAADMVLYEKVDIYNITNGGRFSTYIIEGERGSGTICLNGAAARLVSKGDQIIIASYANYEDAEIHNHEAKCILVDENNKIAKWL